MSIHNSYCKACGEGILTQQNRIREISYKDTILKVKEFLFECEECGVQPSTTSLMRDHRRDITTAKKQYDELLDKTVEKLIANFKTHSEVIAYKIDPLKIWLHIKNENGYSYWYCYKDKYLKDETAYSNGKHHDLKDDLSNEWVLL